MFGGNRLDTIPNVLFHSRISACKSPYGAVPFGQTVSFSLFPERKQQPHQLLLWIGMDGREPISFPLRWFGASDMRDQYSVSFCPKEAGLYWYYFTATFDGATRYVSRGYGGQCEILDYPGDQYQLTVYDPAYQPPRWFGEGITYHIFPDRFYRDAPLKQPTGEGVINRVLHETWSGQPIYQPNEQGEVLNNDFFGGTLRGVIQKLDYLESLSVQNIYFNPIFQAYSNHRYDTGDYKRIDPMLGSEEDFIELCQKAAARGMRVILDGVFNHTGYDSRYFNARGHYDSVGAYQSQDSPYYSWYDFQKFPDRYSAWWGVYTLPQVNELNPSYLDYIVEDEDSVVRRWLRLGASGWRLDVADELPDEFIRRLNTAAKQEKSDALIIGEVWEDASNKISYSERRTYLQGGELDAVMNYPLRTAILSFLNGGTSEHFIETIECLRENYPRDVFYNLMNSIGTHDTPRALTMLGVSEEIKKRLDRDERADYRLSPDRLLYAKKRLYLATVIQFTMPGSPTIYYGDEAGMQGFEDPLNRCPYPWGAEDMEILSFYRRLCALRKKISAFTDGDLQFLPSADGALLQYERRNAQERVIVLVNRGHQTLQTTINMEEATELLSGQTVQGNVIFVPPETAFLLLCKNISQQEENHNMDMKETQLSQEYFFEGKIMKSRLDMVRLPNGKTAQREICEHVGGVGILPIDAEGNIILVRQFRYPFLEELLEIPAGKLDHGETESIETCGIRELKEETGYTAGRIIPLGAMYPSPGFLTEVTYLFAALDLTPGETQPDEDEFVEKKRLPIAEVERMIAADELRDAKTIAAMYRARLKGLF